MKLTVMITSYVFIAAISFLPRYIYPCLDPSPQETVGRNIFLEHRNFVLNVPISILLTTHDSTACAVECLTDVSVVARLTLPLILQAVIANFYPRTNTKKKKSSSQVLFITTIA